MPTSKTDRPTVIVTSPVLTAISGIAAGTEMLLNSDLSTRYKLLHFVAGRQGRRTSPLRSFYRVVASPLQLGLILLRGHAAILHINTSLYPKSFWRDIAYTFVGNLMGIPVILQIHGGKSPQAFARKNPIIMLLIRFALRRAIRVVVVSQEDQVVYQDFLATPGGVTWIPNAVDLDHLRTDNPKSIGKGIVTAVFMGRLIEAKGLFEIVQAIHLLYRRGLVVNLQLKIAGSGPAEPRLQKLVTHLGLERVVEFVGEVHGPDKVAFWETAHVLLFPTFHREKMPNTILESIGTATPLITCPVSGIRDVIQDGVHGFFVEPHDPEGLAECVLALLSDPAAYTQMSQACRERAEAFNLTNLVRRFDELYTDVLG